jgi:hypothetical protein
MLRLLVTDYVTRTGVLVPHGLEITELVRECAAFFENSTVRMRFFAPIANLRLGDGIDTFSVDDRITVRRLTDEELTELSGGRLDLLGFGNSQLMLDEFVFSGVFDDPKVIGGHVASSEQLAGVRATLDQAVMALHILKDGPIGCPMIHFRADAFVPNPCAGAIGAQEQIPIGMYKLDENELDDFRKCALAIDKLSVPLQAAISRLNDAQRRYNPRDRMIDAVIGLEALLVQDHGSNPSFKAALHFALMQDEENLDSRLASYRKARALYGLRNSVAHGGSVKPKLLKDFLGREGNLHEAAKESCAMLRVAIKRCLRFQRIPGTSDWERAYFGGSVFSAS